MVREVERTYQIQVTVPANQAANSILPASIIQDPSVGSVNSLTVPQDRAIVIEDITIDSAPTADGILVFEKNLEQKVGETQPLSRYVGTNPARPTITPIVYEPGDIMTVKYINLKAGGAADETITVTLKVVEVIAD